MGPYRPFGIFLGEGTKGIPRSLKLQLVTELTPRELTVQSSRLLARLGVPSRGRFVVLHTKACVRRCAKVRTVAIMFVTFLGYESDPKTKARFTCTVLDVSIESKVENLGPNFVAEKCMLAEVAAEGPYLKIEKSAYVKTAPESRSVDGCIGEFDTYNLLDIII